MTSPGVTDAGDVQSGNYNGSRLNAWKHGLTAKTKCLPGENAEALQARVDVYKKGLETRNELEDELARLVAEASWRLERANRAEVARVHHEVVTKSEADDLCEAMEVVALEKRLFFDPRGPAQLYPSREYDGRQPRTSCEDNPNGFHEPAEIILQMESTVAGCRALIKCWVDLRQMLESGLGWQSHEKLKCVRLLGKQPLDAVSVREVAEIFLACHAIEPQFSYAFQELRCEIHEERFKIHKRQLERWERAGIKPADATAGQAVLLGIVDGAIARLRMLESERQKVADSVEELQADILSFDGKKEGEQLRRHQERCNRLILRNIDSVRKGRRDLAQGWGRTRQERERRKGGTNQDEGGIESKPIDERLVVSEQGIVQIAEDYVAEGLARY